MPRAARQPQIRKGGAECGSFPEPEEVANTYPSGVQGAHAKCSIRKGSYILFPQVPFPQEPPRDASCRAAAPNRKGGAACGSFLYPRRWLTHIPERFRRSVL